MRKILDERERLERQQHWRLILTETLMFLAVIVLVGFLTLVVMGYSFNLRGVIGGGEEIVERSGLVQVSSLPTGATIYIDGEAPLLLNTNASRTMLAGEHEISLARGGFDGWKKKINVTEGMIYRLNYPRLFKEEREAEEVLTFLKTSEKTEGATSASSAAATASAVPAGEVSSVTVSPNNERMVLVQGGALYMVNLNENKPEQKALTLVDEKANVVIFTTFTSMAWSGNSERLLAQVNGKWVVMNVRDMKETVWLDEILGETETIKRVMFETEAGDRLLVLNAEKELLEVSVRDKKVSLLMKGVEQFDNDGERVVYLTEEISEVEEKAEPEKVSKADATLAGFFAETEPVGEVRAYRVGEESSYLVTRIYGEADYKVTDFRVATMRYFQESYVAVASKRTSQLTVFKKTGWVSGDEEMEKVYDGGKVVTETLKKRGKGMVFEQIGAGGEKSVFDIEAMGETEIDAREGEEGWVDEYLRYNIGAGGKLSVRDYDGLNERTLVAEGVLTGRTVAISGNNRWLYYFVKMDDGAGEKLVRERIN